MEAPPLNPLRVSLPGAGRSMQWGKLPISAGEYRPLGQSARPRLPGNPRQAQPVTAAIPPPRKATLGLLFVVFLLA